MAFEPGPPQLTANLYEKHFIFDYTNFLIFLSTTKAFYFTALLAKTAKIRENTSLLFIVFPIYHLIFTLIKKHLKVCLLLSVLIISYSNFPFRPLPNCTMPLEQLLLQTLKTCILYLLLIPLPFLLCCWEILYIYS